MHPAFLGCMTFALWADWRRSGNPVTVEIVEGARRREVDFAAAKVTDTHAEPSFVLAAVPEKHTPSGVLADRPAAFCACLRLRRPGAGEHRVLLRTRQRSPLPDKLLDVPSRNAAPTVTNRGTDSRRLLRFATARFGDIKVTPSS
jgi:hypothetical protein